MRQKQVQIQRLYLVSKLNGRIFKSRKFYTEEKYWAQLLYRDELQYRDKEGFKYKYFTSSTSVLESKPVPVSMAKLEPMPVPRFKPKSISCTKLSKLDPMTVS